MRLQHGPRQRRQLVAVAGGVAPEQQHLMQQRRLRRRRCARLVCRRGWPCIAQAVLVVLGIVGHPVWPCMGRTLLLMPDTMLWLGLCGARSALVGLG